MLTAVTIQEKKQFLRDLFVGPFRGHAIIVDPVWPENKLGYFLCSNRPARDWAPWIAARYEAMVKQTDAIQDDCVPYATLTTNTGAFAAAFGCKLHTYTGMETNACALPAVETAAEADALPEPDPRTATTLARFMDLAHAVRERLGPDIPIGVPDVQSPFDIAALVWRKENLLMAMYEEPEAVHRLVDKCHRLLRGFMLSFKQEFPNSNLCHCPTAWAPPEFGIWLSEDEAGTMSTAMFDTFCLPSLQDLSRTFGGMFMHCCAAADHQYPSFRKIPNLRGLNRVFQAPGPQPAIDAFSGETVLMQAWLAEDHVRQFLSMARPNTRFLFNLSSMKAEDAKPVVERLRRVCGR